jgi:hypothetical protein
MQVAVPDSAGCRVSSRYLDWANFSEADLVDYDADVILAADCTYSEDICYHLANVISILLSRNRRSYQKWEGEASDNLADVCGQYPYALIACTLRNIDTFQFFIDSLKIHPVVVRDLTDDAAIIVDNKASVSLIHYPTHIWGHRNTRDIIRLIRVTPSVPDSDSDSSYR